MLDFGYDSLYDSVYDYLHKVATELFLIDSSLNVLTDGNKTNNCCVKALSIRLVCTSNRQSDTCRTRVGNEYSVGLSLFV
jgi:hypothetical protein